MKIVANGKHREVGQGATVLSFLQQRNLAADRVVVERNGKPLHRERFAETVLHAGDRLEIAQMVGGG